MKTLIAFFVGFISAFCLHAQTPKTTYVISHAQPVDTNRYQDVKGSPYLFKKFVKARITSNQMEVTEDVPVNFNGYTKTFEVMQGKWYTELDGKWYLQIELVEDDQGEEASILYRRGLHKKFKDEFVQICYKGKHLMLIKYQYVDLMTKEVQDVGKTVEFKRFHPKSLYYLLTDGQLTLLKNKKKALLKSLDHSKELEQYIKEEKINLAKDEDFARLIEFYEKISF